jgi:hypothetical protein
MWLENAFRDVLFTLRDVFLYVFLLKFNLVKNGYFPSLCLCDKSLPINY